MNLQNTDHKEDQLINNTTRALYDFNDQVKGLLAIIDRLDDELIKRQMLIDDLESKVFSLEEDITELNKSIPV